MVKTIAVSYEKTLEVPIPEQYIGKKIEIIILPIDSENENDFTEGKQSVSQFKGILSETDYQNLKDATNKVRKEWERDFC